MFIYCSFYSVAYAKLYVYYLPNLVACFAYRYIQHASYSCQSGTVLLCALNRFLVTHERFMITNERFYPLLLYHRCNKLRHENFASLLTAITCVSMSSMSSFFFVLVTHTRIQLRAPGSRGFLVAINPLI